MKKFLIFSIISLFSLLLIACSDDEDKGTSAETDITDIEEDVVVEKENEQEVIADQAGDISFESVLEEIEQISEGETNIIYEHSDAQVHEEEEYIVSLDGYVVAEINDFHANFAIPFNDEDEGAILLSHFTIENKTSDDIAYTPNWSLQYTGADRHPGQNSSIIPDERQIAKTLNANNYAISANETVSGYYAILLRSEDVENIKDVNVATIPIPEAGDEYDPDNYEYKNKIGSKTEFSIVVSSEGSSKQKADEAFYQDRTNIDNMGDKTMIKEKDNIGVTEILGNSEITLKGYQFTEFEPNEHEAPRFDNFDTGIVLLNIKLEVANGEDEAIDITTQKAKLTVNDGKQYALVSNMLSPHGYGDAIEVDETKEAILVFALDKEQYEKIWKDKSFELEYGPLQSPDLDDLTEGKKVQFDLPM